MPEPTLDDLLRAIVKAERTTCGWTKQSSHIYDRCWCTEGDCSCHSLSFVEVHGRVPRFPELRDMRGHDWCSRDEPTWCTRESSEPSCHGLGYVPLWSKPEDLATWIRVLAEAINADGALEDSGYEPFLACIETGKLFGAFQAAVTALGINVQEQTP